MGIDLHGLRFLQYAAKKGPFGETATLGRQNIHVSDEVLRSILKTQKNYGPFCEELLIERFGSSSVTSFDASDYENASVVHDFNKPLDHGKIYDTVIDFGTLEHIFNVPVALKNVASICKRGGQIIHALPANNYNGHGFWQFSPELFFSLYSSENGFSDTEVFVAELDDNKNWWKANVPKNGVRVEYTSANRSYVLAVTRKQAVETSQNVQQSDYVVNWQGQTPNFKPIEPGRVRFHHALKQAVRRVPLAWRLPDVIVPLPNSHADAWIHRLSIRNQHYTKMPIALLIPSV